MDKLQYKGYWDCDCVCGLELVFSDAIVKGGKKVKVILTELDENTGTSVTNMIEQLATLVYHRYLEGVPTENITWIEHYPERGTRKEIPETFDQVEMKWDSKQFRHPVWKPYKGVADAKI